MPEQEPIVLTENPTMAEWMGRLLELRWFERGLEEANWRSSHPSPTEYVVFDLDTYQKNIEAVLQERLNALLEACPMRLETPAPTKDEQGFTIGWEPSPEQRNLQPGDRVRWQWPGLDPVDGSVAEVPEAPGQRTNAPARWWLMVLKDGKRTPVWCPLEYIIPIPPESALDAARKALKQGDFVYCEHNGRTIVGVVGKEQKPGSDSVHLRLVAPSGPGGNIYPRLNEVFPLKKVVDDAPSTG